MYIPAAPQLSPIILYHGPGATGEVSQSEVEGRGSGAMSMANMAALRPKEKLGV